MRPRRLAASNIVVSFGERGVLRDVNLQVDAGRRLALLGANGSGKSTLLRVLSGALRPNGGEVTVDGCPLEHSRRGLIAHRQAVQLLVQDPDDQLFGADVFRDVAFGPTSLGLPEDVVRARVQRVLDALSIADLAPRPIHELSFGQRKRVAIAGALALDPGVLLLDEPTAGLDPAGVDELLVALDASGRLAEETEDALPPASPGALGRPTPATVVLATHDVDFALGWADEVAVLESGRLHTGPPAQVLGDADLIARARLRRPIIHQVAALLDLPTENLTHVTDLRAGRPTRPAMPAGRSRTTWPPSSNAK